MLEGFSDRQKIGLVGLGLAIALTVGYWLGAGKSAPAKVTRDPVVEEFIDRPSDPKKVVEMVRVHVMGAVAQPGVYDLAKGSRVEDAIEAAGSTEQTDFGSVNLAKILKDGDLVEVGVMSLTPVGSASYPIRINEASAAEIASLPGIGDGMAHEIVRWRSEMAPFAGPDDLERIPGLGPETVRRILPYIAFN